jgi:hypothetical protein
MINESTDNPISISNPHYLGEYDTLDIPYKFKKINNIKNQLNEINDVLKMKLYKKYTSSLYEIVNKMKDENNMKDENSDVLCNTIAKINICMPETYYTYGAYIMGVVVGQMQKNVITDLTPDLVFICAIIEDYAFIMDKYQLYINKTTKTETENKNAIYIGNCAKYMYRILNSLYLINSKTKKTNTDDIIDNINNDNIKEEMKYAKNILRLKSLKNTPNNQELLKNCATILFKLNDANVAVTFENFINLIDKIIKHSYNNITQCFDQYINCKNKYKQLCHTQYENCKKNGLPTIKDLKQY